MGVSKITGAGSGDMAVLHSTKNQDDKNQITFGAKGQEKYPSSVNQNNMKTIEMIQLEGTFKLRKIFTSRSSIN